MDSKIVFDVGSTLPPRFLPLDGQRRLIVLKQTKYQDGSDLSSPIFSFCFSDCHPVRLADIFSTVVSASSYADRNALRYSPRDGKSDEYIFFADDRAITEDAMVSICNAFNKSNLSRPITRKDA